MTRALHTCQRRGKAESMAPQQRERSLQTGSAYRREALPVEELDREGLSEREVRLRRAMVVLRERAVEHVAAHGSAPAGLHEALRAFAAELRSVRALGSRGLRRSLPPPPRRPGRGERDPGGGGFRVGPPGPLPLRLP